MTGIVGLKHALEEIKATAHGLEVVMGLPAIVINGKVVDAGPGMSRARLKALLTSIGTRNE